MSSACFGRGVRSPSRQLCAVRVLTRNSLAAASSPISWMYVLRSMPEVLHGSCTAVNNFRTRLVDGHGIGAVFYC